MILEFLKSHFLIILIIVVLAIIAYLAFYITTLSIKNLKTAIFSSYPFDVFFPSERSWSAGFFLIVILAFGLLIYAIASGNFYLGGPA